MEKAVLVQMLVHARRVEDPPVRSKAMEHPVEAELVG